MTAPVPLPPLVWGPASEFFAGGHLAARTPLGEMLAGPRASDGGWEFSPPGSTDWIGIEETWSMEECLRAAEAWLAWGMRAQG